jgi:hypothetical protein
VDSSTIFDSTGHRCARHEFNLSRNESLHRAGYAAQVTSSRDGHFLLSDGGEVRTFVCDWRSSEVLHKWKMPQAGDDRRPRGTLSEKRQAAPTRRSPNLQEAQPCEMLHALRVQHMRALYERNIFNTLVKRTNRAAPRS